MKNILVALKEGNHAKLLLDQATPLALKFGSKIWLLHVADPEPDFVGNKVGPQYVRDNLAKELRQEHQFLQNLANELAAKGIQAEGLLIQGATVEMILNEVDRLDIDLVVIGRHHHSWLDRLLTGSTHPAVVRKATVPVLIVPLPE
jgi:nucleotide-binding universal stress UspA family protein